MNRFEKNINLKFRSLIRHLKKCYSSSDPKTLHRIRVDIKDIKAILAVINDKNEDFNAHKHFKPLREIFRNAGALREPDVITSLLHQHQIGVSYADLIPDDEVESIKAFKAELQHSIREVKNLRNKLNVNFKRIHRDDLERYLRRKKEKIKLQLYPKPQVRTLHKTRKAIKEVIYLSKADGPLKKKEKTFYDQMQDVIGNLHDKQVLLGLLKMKRKPTGGNQYKAIKSACLSDKKEILRLAINHYRNQSQT